jgi:ferredoxin
MKVKIDSDRCAGCGLCEEQVPEFFKMGKYSAAAKQAQVPESLEQSIISVAADCPAEAILIEEMPT